MIGKNGKSEFLEIALIDNLTEIDFLDEFYKKPHTKIISFDYQTHIFLEKRNIPHDISDNFLNNEKTQSLQKLVYGFLKWYELELVNKTFCYEKINLGKLFTDQFLPSLANIIKKFTEIEKIVNLYPNSKFFATNDLLNILKIFPIKSIEIYSKKIEKFYFDEINLKFRLGKKLFTIPISFRLYQILKNYSEKIFDRFYGLKQNDFKNSKFTLLVEFNTKHYRDFFSNSKFLGKNILYYGRRRPGIWDLESLLIFSKSDCKLFTSMNHSKKIENNDEIFIQLEKSFLSLLESSELHDFFSINSKSILSIIKPKLIQLILPKIKTTIKEIDLSKLIFEKKLIDSVVILSEMGFSEQIISNFAIQMKIPIFHLQEGFYYDANEFYERSNALGIFPNLAQKNIVWGEIFENYIINVGKINPQKIVALGSPRFSNLEFKKNIDRCDFILLATMPPQIEEINGINTNNLIKYYSDIEKICDIITKNNKKLIIKLHPTLDVFEFSKNIPKKFPNVQVISTGDIEPLIRSSSFVIVTGLSTVMIQGQILQKPVVSIPLIEYNFGIPSIYKKNGCLLTSVNKFESILKKIENDNNFREYLIKDGNRFLDFCIKHRRSSSKLIWDYIKKFISDNKI